MAIDVTTLALAKAYAKGLLESWSGSTGKNVTIESIVAIDGGNRITFGFTDDNGVAQEKALDVMDGKDGADGKNGTNGTNGKDGTSPVISVSTITGGHRITITDANGTKTVDVMDGSDGKNGNDGASGDDGVTPQFSIGTVETLEAGSAATASIVGTAEKPVLNLGIPKGKDGSSDSGGNADQTAECENLNLFYSALIRRKANPKEPLAITTYPGGADQPTHPKVLYFANGWNGHKYWMVYTPYPNNNSFQENPCITYSDDGINWSEEGISNPIISSQKGGCWWSDPHLVYIPETNTVELWVRWCSNGADGMENGWEGVYRLKSTDGVNWSEKEYLYHVVDTAWASVLSPSVIYDDGKYKIWFCYKRECLKYYESTDGTSWQHIKDISVNLTPLGNYKLWHFDMIKTDKGYEFVGCYQINGQFDRNNYIAYSWSADNHTYAPAVCILANGASGQFDDLELYRPTLVKIGNKYRMYYGAQKNIKIWHIGMVEAPNMGLLHELLAETSTVTLPEYSGSGDSGETEKTLASISATYSGGNVAVGTSLSSLTGIVVTATYDDGSTATVTGYTLSGTIAEGSNTVTVSYGGMTTTFTVTGIVDSGDDGITAVVNSFEESAWTKGYYYDKGVLKTTDGVYLSSFIMLPSEVQYVHCINTRNIWMCITYFDADKNYLGYDRGNGMNADNGGGGTLRTIALRTDVENATYYTVSAFAEKAYMYVDSRQDIDTVFVVANFTESRWHKGYYNDTGAVTTELNMYHSDCLPIATAGGMVTTTVTTDSYLRISYFDADLNYLEYDNGGGHNSSSIAVKTDITNAVYYAINCNTADKSAVSVT